ncbi:hypothetical protein AAC387_Pa07g3293 [Persea americana]
MLGPNVDGPLCGEHFDGSIPHNLSHIADGYSLHDTVISGIRPPSSWSHKSFRSRYLLPSPSWVVRASRALLWLHLYA